MIKIKIDDELYPKSLKSIPNPPSLLYAEGNVDLLNSYSIAIIGSRHASENGKRITQKFATELSTIGITIVSGLAEGIDTVAHSFSYDKKGRTIAVLGGGLNKIFPEKNVELYHKILKNDGLIITEYQPNEEIQSKYFLARNRIVSGLSLGILVIEAKYRSGTSVTAKLAQKQGREVFTIPHEIWDSNGIGTNRLIKNGAKLVSTTLDILEILKLNRLKSEYLQLKKSGAFKDIDYSYNTFSNPLPSNFPNLFSNNSSEISSSMSKEVTLTDKKQKYIYNILCSSSSSVSINDLVLKTSYSINEILSILFMLEVEGYIKKVEGGYTCI